MTEEGKAAQHNLEEQQRMRMSMALNDTKNRDLQVDKRLKFAEENNRKLGEELKALKEKLEKLDPTVASKEQKGRDFLDDLSKIFDDDRSFIKGGMFEAGNLLCSDGDMNGEYEFKINLMEHDLQSCQAENNNLVQTVLKLKQEFKEKKNLHDEISVKIINQEIAQHKRDIKEADDKIESLKEEIDALRSKIASSSSSAKNLPLENVRDMKRIIEQLEQSNKVALMELWEVKERNRKKKAEIDSEKSKRQSEKTKIIDQTEKDSMLLGELRNKMMSLSAKLSYLEQKKMKDKANESSMIQEAGSTLNKQHLLELRESNERLMSEVMRLKAVIKEQKKSEQNRLEQSMSISAIHFNEQSFNQSFMSNFK